MQFQLYSINKDFVNIAAYETEPEQKKKVTKRMLLSLLKKCYSF